MKKNAQMEIMGLAIIAVLLVMGMLFAVRFIIFSDEEAYRENYVDTQLAANTLNALLLTNTDCLGVSIAELLEDASKTNPSIKCDGKESTDYAPGEIDTILKATLTSIKKDFYFEASTKTKPDPLVKIGTRPNNRERQTKMHFLPGASIGDTITILLDIYS